MIHYIMLEYICVRAAGHFHSFQYGYTIYTCGESLIKCIMASQFNTNMQRQLKKKAVVLFCSCEQQILAQTPKTFNRAY